MRKKSLGMSRTREMNQKCVISDMELIGQVLIWKEKVMDMAKDSLLDVRWTVLSDIETR